MKYDFAAIESRWQQQWDADQTYQTRNPDEAGFDPNAGTFYVLDMFPYPSGVGLHVGHPLGYIATDILARFRRMCGDNVLHPMGFDAFGLPAEQFAVEHGVHPAITTQQNIDNMVRQLKRLGLGYDWSRMISTTDPGYYRWTQWIFLQLYKSWFDPIKKQARSIAELQQSLEAEDYYVNFNGDLIFTGADEDMQALSGDPIGTRKWHELEPDQQQRLLDEYRLAYLAEVPVNWCPQLGTVLANEEVTNEGRSERGNYPVYKRPLKQWMLRITTYADRLADELDLVDWPESTKQMQRNWIGRSHGAEVDFEVAAKENAPSEPRPSGSGSETEDRLLTRAARSGSDSQSSLESITVFTTRPDTLFGATYMVLAPEHELVGDITTDAQRDAVEQYQQQAAARDERDRMMDAKEKTGVFTGAYAINPVNQQHIPIWIADYVLTGYGTGAIMAVPAHDERDHAFAKKFDLPILAVIAPPKGHDIQEEAWTGDGVTMNSEHEDLSLNGLNVTDAKQLITDWLVARDLGKAKVQYKLRDWLFSRQRYWGEPFPVLHDVETGEIVPVDESELPVELPEMDDFSPAASDDPDAPPKPPLSRAPESWRIVERDGRKFERELNTMPQWAGSCWYYLRFLDPKNAECFVAPQVEQYWMGGPERAATVRERSPEDARTEEGRFLTGAARSDDSPALPGVDLYVGGVEHAVLHLLYARFWHKVLFDLGYVSTPEPFGKLFNQGYIQAYCYRDDRGIAVPADEVVDQDGQPAMQVQDQPDRQFFFEGKPVTQEYGKMGKSLKNAVNPDDICEQYGCDTLRLYEMYMGPLDQSKPWNTRDIVGVHRFLQRVWRNVHDEETGELLLTNDQADEALQRLTHRTIKRVTEAMQAMSFNTAIAALIELNNALVALPKVPRDTIETLLKMLAPFAPHIAEQLWHDLGHPESVTKQVWPDYDETMLVEATVEIAVQIMGKVRGRIEIAPDADEATVVAAAQADEKIAAALEGKIIRKVIYIQGKLLNLVAN